MPEVFALQVEVYAKALDQSERLAATSAQKQLQAGSNLGSTSIGSTWLGIRQAREPNGMGRFEGK